MEQLKHECGIAIVRLRKPLDYYNKKYGTWMYGLNKMYLLMEKQHNRGQDGAGLVCIKLNAAPGEEYLYRERAEGNTAISTVFNSIQKELERETPIHISDPIYAEKHVPYAGECYMGHLKYDCGPHRGVTYVHPMARRSNWRAKSLALCGNFSLTSLDKIFDEITSVGQHPRNKWDGHILLEQISHKLDREIERCYRNSKALGLEGMDITHDIEANIDLTNVLKKCSPIWDGGYVMCGVTGSGETFAMRDPMGIRPCFYYVDDEIVVVASERPVIQTVMNLTYDKIKELPAGHALTINQTADTIKVSEILPPAKNNACSFERIYFSRGSDIDIYTERKELGSSLVDPVLKSVDYDIDNTVFSFIPNTAEVAYFGLIEGLNLYLNNLKAHKINEAQHELSVDEINSILAKRIRSEKVAIKDIKLRTFISENNTRNDLAGHVYDITYGSLRRGIDNLVIIDDSIVRGTTLRESILSILDRLGPKKIVVVSSSPQVRYPDFYGIDMTNMTEFLAFRAAIALLEEKGMWSVIHDTYHKAKKALIDGTADKRNYSRDIYTPLDTEDLNRKMVELIRPDHINAEVSLVYQTLEGLHKSCPNHPGDWYFSGYYPTPGGNVLVNKAYITFYEEEYIKRP